MVLPREKWSLEGPGQTEERPIKPKRAYGEWSEFRQGGPGFCLYTALSSRYWSSDLLFRSQGIQRHGKLIRKLPDLTYWELGLPGAEFQRELI
jgi:hypothetical protein